MTKIMSLWLIMLLCWNNQALCSENRMLPLSGSRQDDITIYGHHRFLSSMISSNTAEINFCFSSHHNFLECNVLPSVKEIRLKFQKSDCLNQNKSHHNNVILKILSFDKTVKIVCDFEKNSHHNNVIVYSCNPIALNGFNRGYCNSFRVVSPDLNDGHHNSFPVHWLIMPVAVAGGIGFVYWMFWGKSEK